jgi:hypothetical protein
VAEAQGCFNCGFILVDYISTCAALDSQELIFVPLCRFGQPRINDDV